MLETLRTISLPHFASHKLRTALTVLGVALGVATHVGLQMAFDPVIAATRVSYQTLSGRADLQISNGTLGVQQELLDEVRQTPGVSAASASIAENVSLVGHPGERVYVLGVDLIADEKIRDYKFVGSPGSGAGASIEDPLIFMAKADSIAVTDQLLKAFRLKVGDKLEVFGAQGKAALTVRGVLDGRQGPASAFAGRVAVMDIYAAQKMFHMGRSVSEIDIALDRRAPAEKVRAQLEKRVQGRAQVQDQLVWMKMVEKLVRLEQANLTAMALISSLLGIYMIFATMMVSVAQRRREIGVLRSLGMSRRSIIAMIVAESLVLGIVAAIFGVALGDGLARLMSGPIAVSAGHIRPADVPPVHLGLMPALLGAGSGLFAAIVAALLPARQALRVSPLEAIRPPVLSFNSLRSYAIAALVGCALLVTSPLSWFEPRWFTELLMPWRHDISDIDMWLVMRSMAVLFIGMSLVVPYLVCHASLLLDWAFSASMRSSSLIANRNLEINLRRTALAVSAYVMSVMLAIGIAAAFAAFHRQFDMAMGQLAGDHDLMISAGDPFRGESGLIAPSLIVEIGSIPGVERVDALRFAALSYRDHLENVVAEDFEPGLPELELLEGERSRVAADLKRGGAVIDEAFARETGAKLNSVLTIPSPSGSQEIPVVGVTNTINIAVGKMFVDRSWYGQRWNDNRVTLIEPVLKKGADRESVMSTIRTRFGDRYAISVVTIDTYRKEISDQIHGQIGLLIPMIAIAVAVAVLGLVNGLFASVLDRFREFGTMRAVGGTRSQIGRMVTLEAALIGGFGGLLAVPIGLWFSYFNILSNRHIAHLAMVWAWPSWTFQGLLIGGTLALGAVAGYFPGRNASRIVVIQALAAE